MAKKNKTKNPLDCGCASFGTSHIDPITGKIEYKDIHVRLCEFHAGAADKIAALEAELAAAREALRNISSTLPGSGDPQIEEYCSECNSMQTTAAAFLAKYPKP